jgi:hypothetical protein
MLRAFMDATRNLFRLRQPDSPSRVASYELLSVPRRVGNGLVSSTFNGLALVIPSYCVMPDNL